MNDTKIYIYGGGGHGKVVIETIEAQYGPQSIVGIFDDDPKKKNLDFYGHKIIGSIKEFPKLIPNLILAIGDNETRRTKSIEIKNLITSFVSAIDPYSRISHSVKISSGTLVMPGVIINADATIGNHCILNTNATIEHDCFVDDFTHIAPNTVLTGAVKIGKASMIGANSVIVPGIKIGDNCLIAAGSVVTTNIPDNAIVRGNPARLLKIRKKK